VFWYKASEGRHFPSNAFIGESAGTAYPWLGFAYR
jgi:hypothetical protein